MGVARSWRPVSEERTGGTRPNGAVVAFVSVVGAGVAADGVGETNEAKGEAADFSGIFELSTGGAKAIVDSLGLSFGSIGISGLLAAGFGGNLNEDGAVDCADEAPGRVAGAATFFACELHASRSILSASCSAACFCHLVDGARCDTPSEFVVDDPKD
jgi:hypothetical protein